MRRSGQSWQSVRDTEAAFALFLVMGSYTKVRDDWAGGSYVSVKLRNVVTSMTKLALECTSRIVMNG